VPYDVALVSTGNFGPKGIFLADSVILVSDDEHLAPVTVTLVPDNITIVAESAALVSYNAILVPGQL
jgi:hypothetical protein